MSNHQPPTIADADMRRHDVVAGTASAAGAVIRRAAMPMAVALVWAVVTTAGLIDPVFVPSPAGLVAAFKELWPRLPGAIIASTAMTIAGFVGGSALGLGLGLAMTYSRTIRDLFGGVIDVLRPVPTFALIPLFVLWFGLGKAPQIALIMFGTAIILSLATLEAVRNVPTIYIRAALLFGADRWTVYKTIIVPSITPHLLGATRAAAAASWGRDVAAEFIGAQTGLGYLMIIHSQVLDTAGIVVIIIVYSLLAIALDTLIRLIQRPITAWTGRDASIGAEAAILGAT